jgi:hypothetical protein
MSREARFSKKVTTFFWSGKPPNNVASKLPFGRHKKQASKDIRLIFEKL